MQPILVRHLRLESISDPTPDPYGQPGFSALIAYVNELNSTQAALLRKAAEEGAVIVVRCATLEVEGRIAKPLSADRVDTITISVDDLRYFKPDSRIPVERRKLPNP